MGMRTVHDPYGSPAVLVDHTLGNSYDVVRKVATNIDFVKRVSTLFDVDGAVIANLHKRYSAIAGQTDFVLPVPVSSENDINVFVNNLWKSPVTSFVTNDNLLSFQNPLNEGDFVDVMIISDASIDAMEKIKEDSIIALEAIRNNTQDLFDATVLLNTSAQKWAENPEDVEVSEGKYSALHHSAKAREQRLLSEAALDSFDERYLGAKAVAPTVDNDGNVLLVGAVYWDTVSSQMFTWSGVEWRPTFLTGNAVRQLTTATGGQTAVTVPTYLVGANTIQVYLNGLKVMVGADYTETDQNTITFLSGLTAGDEVEVIVLQPYVIGTTGAESITTEYGVTLARLLELREGSVADLLADTTLNPAVVPEGSVIEAGGFSYQVDSTAPRGFVTTAGLVRLRVKPNADGRVDIRQFGIVQPYSAANDTRWQDALNSEHPLIIPQGLWNVAHLTIPGGFRGMYGAGGMANGFSTLVHAPGQEGSLMSWQLGFRVTNSTFENLHLVGNMSPNETYGIDFSGFGYCMFNQVYVRGFSLDGLYADGSAIPNNALTLNNTFVCCRSNNNGRSGIRFENEADANNENTANTFIGCETSGNGSHGVFETYSESSRYIGHTSQANPVDFESNGRKGTFIGYIENNPKAFRLGEKSYGWEVRTRSTHPNWNTFIDSGERNDLSVGGGQSHGAHLFENPHFQYLRGDPFYTPINVSRNGVPVITSYPDSGNPFGSGILVQPNAQYQGLIFHLNKPASALAGKWVTIAIDMDSSGIVDPLQLRIYTRNGATNYQVNGAYVNELFPVTDAGTFKTFYYDVLFQTDLSATPSILWYLDYTGTSVGSNLIRIRSVRIVEGQTRQVDWPNTNIQMQGVSRANLEDISHPINIHQKKEYKQVFDTTAGKVRFCLWKDPGSAWVFMDGSDPVTPI